MEGNPISSSDTPASRTTEDRGARDRLRGIVLIVIASSMFAVVDGLSKILAETQSVGQIVWARYAIALPFALASTRPRDWRGLFRTARPGLQLLRAAAPLVISVAMVLAVRYLPLAEATVVLFAGPFIVVALSAPLLRERAGLASWIGVIVGFIAIIVVSRPGFSQLSIFAVFPLLAAVFYALLQLVTRQLGAAGEAPATTLAWTLAVGAVVATPVVAFTWAPVSLSAGLLMVALGVVFGLSQLLMIRAFAHAPAGVLAPFSYVQIIAATVLGIVAFGEVPDLWTFVGIAMIIAAGVYVLRNRNEA